MPRRPDLHRQRGAISVMAAVLIATVAIGAMVSIDVGYVFYSQRQLQKAVDLAALSGAQQLKRADDLSATTANVMASVTAAASQNGYGPAVSPDCSEAATGAADGMRACLGLWDPGDPDNGDSVRHFNAAYSAATVAPNAVRVQGTLTVPLMFVLPGGASRQLRAEAIASGSPPVASFTLGSGVLDFNTANSILSRLLGNTIQLSAADWSGLVGANITLGDLLKLRTDVGTVDQLLNTSLSIREFYALVLQAAGKSSLLNAVLGTPGAEVGISGIDTRLTLSQLLDLGVLTPAASSAAEVALNVASLLTTAAYIAPGTNGVTLDGLNLNLGIASATGRLYVIEPPKVAVGPARRLADGTWRTTASTAQIGLKLAVGAELPLVVANAKLNLPLWLTVGTAKGDLTALQCAATPAQRRATVNVSTGVVQACLAGAGTSCAPAGVPVDLIAVSLLGSNVVATRVRGVPASPTTAGGSAGSNIELAPGGHATTSARNPLGDAVSGLLSGINPQLSVRIAALDIASIDAGAILQPFLAPVGLLLDSLTGVLLNALGISIANADVWLNGVDCNNAELVY
ncbi:TadG family pilus assembly protein [Cupriavidus pauculus]|uniref:TadG family pilus assembly protein n=1 Tax=Cupriavidus pauculus TaxID=82633 RepID=UPI001EE1D209|nr:TadG family pilus assembly protein [Cupriavidus pauculus]GJG94482.1 hypothetical protein CBA19C6_08355 [Cupriavidus pauculus]